MTFNIDDNKKIKEFSELCSEVVRCRKCFKEFKMEKFYTFFDGSLFAPIMIVGQSPVYPLPREKTRPFSLLDDMHQHKGSRWLRKCFDEATLDYKAVYITNLVKDSADNNKVNDKMIENCSIFLEKELEMFKGKVILTFGSSACKYFKVKPNDSRNYKNGTYVFGTYHPSYVMRGGEERRNNFINTLKMIKELIDFKKKEKSLDDYK